MVVVSNAGTARTCIACSNASASRRAVVASRNAGGSRRNTAARAANLPPDLMKAMQDPAMQEKMKQMQEMMKKPEIQQQMAEMQAYMQNQALQARMAELRNDPDFKEMFEEIQKGGMGALMKYMNDPRVLAKLGEKLGDIQPVAPAAAAAAAATAGARPMGGTVPEIDNLFDAAKYGDLEAVEDFVAIGKNVNDVDGEQRTPLHWAAGYNHAEIAMLLIQEGANLEARDSKLNTPLHYSAGYGRPQLVELLLARGADKNAKNDGGKTPYELATLDERNPLNQVPEVLAKLKC